MKGVVFTEFLDMVDATFGPHITETIIAQSDLPSGCAYTSIGTYDHAEIVALTYNLSKATKLDVPVLIKAFGTHLMGRFSVMFPEFFGGDTDLLAFVEGVDGYIHREVRKLYPDATLPDISTFRPSADSLEVHYRSNKMMGDLAEGLIAGAVTHFGTTHTISREDMPTNGGVQWVKFNLNPVR